MVTRINITLMITIGLIASAYSQPKLSLDKPEINLGTIYSGTKKQGKLVLKNIGTDTLHIYSVQPSCGCTAIKQPKQFLLPNESDVVEIEFNSSGFRGHVEKHINITSNDPTSQNISTKLIAEVKEELRPVTGSSLVWLGSLTIGKTGQQNLLLVNSSDHPIKIKNFSVSSPSVNVIMKKNTLRPNDTLDVQISTKAEKIGYENNTLTIETDSKYQPRTEIRISFICVKE